MQPTFQQLVAQDATREQLEGWCRQQARAVPVTSELVLCRVLGKYLMYCLARDYALTPHLALDGIWEPWVTMAITRHLKPGMRCLDVGACYGYYSVLMGDLVGEAGLVEAWEPYHSDLLKHNAQLNGVPVSVFPDAMGPGGDYVVVAPPPSDGLKLFNAGGVEVVDEDRDTYPYERRVERHQPLGSFHFIKIDVEGYEAQVWDALGQVLLVNSDLTVCMEFTPSKHPDPLVFLAQIETDGFTIGTVGHDGVPRACSVDEALKPDTGDFRMLWLTR